VTNTHSRKQSAAGLPPQLCSVLSNVHQLHVEKTNLHDKIKE
jgi:hypothetical protein